MSTSRLARDPDSTHALLEDDLPNVPDYPDEGHPDEEEVFFGQVSIREKDVVAARVSEQSVLLQKVLTLEKSHYEELPKSSPAGMSNLSSPSKSIDSSKATPPKSCYGSSLAHSPSKVDKLSPYKSETSSPVHNVAHLDDDAESNISLASNCFDNTHDELILYEKFGENYDEVVAEMTKHEKCRLKQEIARAVPKTILQESHDIDVGKTVTERSDILISVKPPTPKPRKLAAEKAGFDFSPRFVESHAALKMLSDELTLALAVNDDNSENDRPKKELRMDKNVANWPKLETSPTCQHKAKAKNYFSTAANEQDTKPSSYSSNPKKTRTGSGDKALQIHTASPKPPLEDGAVHTKVSPMQSNSNKFKTPQRYFGTPFAKGKHNVRNIPSYLRPTSASKMRASPRKDPRTNETIDVTICQKYGHAHSPSPTVGDWHRQHRKAFSSVDMNKVVSPVAMYIKEKPGPPLMRQIRPR